MWLLYRNLCGVQRWLIFSLKGLVLDLFAGKCLIIIVKLCAGGFIWGFSVVIA